MRSAASSGAYPISERDAVLYYGKYRPKGKLPAGTWNGVTLESPFPGLAGDGPYQPTWESLAQYGEAPEWYRDAKFGIWAHWSPQCVAENGDGYARSLYIEGSRDYVDHSRVTGIRRKLATRIFAPSGPCKIGIPKPS